MKRIIIAIVFLLAASGSLSAQTITSNSKISAVTIYSGTARVTRSAKVTLPQGTQSVALGDIIPKIDENTLSVEGKGQAAVKILGAYIKREPQVASVDEKVKELEAQIEAKADQLIMKQNESAVLAQEREFLNSVKLFGAQQIPKDLVTKMPSVDELNNITGFLSSRLTENSRAVENIRLETRILEREKKVLEQKLSQIRGGGSRTVQLLTVDLECVKAGTFELSVSYLVSGAQWRPVYDARAEIGKSLVEMTAFGVITQRTGEDWDDVQLTLSTAQPQIHGRMPYVSPWLLNFRPKQPPVATRARKAIVGVAGSMMQTEAFHDFESREAAEIPAENLFTEVERKGLSVSYSLQRPATVKADGQENKYPIFSQNFQADFEYSAFPRESEYAYLGSRVINGGEYFLLAGPVNVFLEGDYVGRSSLDQTAPKQEFDLYLGIDENMKIKREKISEKLDETFLMGIPASTKKTSYSYKLSAENYTGRPVKVKLFESMPVPQNDKIKARVLEVSLEPTVKDWKDRKGVWLWELKLDNTAKKEIVYSFFVEYPKDENIDL